MQGRLFQCCSKPPITGLWIALDMQARPICVKWSTSTHLTIAVLCADGVEGPSRVAMLLRQNPVAGRAFCSYLAGTACSTGSKAGEPLLCQACLQTNALTRRGP